MQLKGKEERVTWKEGGTIKEGKGEVNRRILKRMVG